ncbi:MAG: response regulator [Pseudomonadota bacterium]
MVKNILIVDDDHIWIRAIKKQFSAYADTFVTLTAGNGNEAVHVLKKNSISLVVTDLQMPEMDGLALLAHLSVTYPDIPVIIMTAYSSPSSKKTVIDGGAAGYIEKPFVVEDLAEKIISTLRKQSEGGTLQTVPLEMFIQLIEMEQKTCTIRVSNKRNGLLGVLFFSKGELMDARVGDQQGVTAAYRVLAWEKVSLSIQDECPIKEKRIDGELQAILFDAMRMKDEAGASETDFAEAEPENLPVEMDDTIEEIDLLEDVPSPRLNPMEVIRGKYQSVSPNGKGLEDVYPDASWQPFCRMAATIGPIFGAGPLKLVFAKSGGPTDYIVVPAPEPIVLAVNDGCPRDKVIDVLSD